LSKNSVLTSQCHKTTILHIRKKKAISGLCPGIIQQPVNALAGSRRTGMN